MAKEITFDTLNSCEKIALNDLLSEIHAFWRASVPNKAISFDDFLKECRAGIKEAMVLHEQNKKNKSPKGETDSAK